MALAGATAYSVVVELIIGGQPSNPVTVTIE
jgi:hypothetical protein